MKHRILGFLALTVLILLTTGVQRTYADDDRYARLRYLEGEVTLYPYDGQRPNDATINSPVMDGDQIETQNGKAELSFRNGIVVRLGDSSSVRVNSTYTPMTLELLQGTIFVDSHMVDRFSDELEVRAGDAQVFLINEGNLRIDLGSKGSVRVTTMTGKAEVRANGTRTLLESGERTYVDPGSAPDHAQAYTAGYDELDDWNRGRTDLYANNGGDGAYVDQSISYEASDLDQYGDWRPSDEYGNVWVPRVDSGWRPYNDGRWYYANDSWFWAGNEPWGWAPYHYGRWGWGLNLGWYWIPGAYFAPSWVSWYNYGDYVGWCPLGYYNRPVYSWGNGYYGNGNGYGYGYGGGQPIQKQKTGALGVDNSWTFVRKEALGDSHLKSVVASPTEVKTIRLDKGKVGSAPDKTLVSYVLPKTVKTPTKYVNDQRSIAPRGPEIESPVGLNHVNENPVHGKTANSGTQSGNNGSTKTVAPRAPEQNWEKSHDAQTGGSKTGTKSSQPSGSTKSGGGTAVKKPTPPNYEHESQFDRNEPAQRLYRSNESPSTKGASKGYNYGDTRKDVNGGQAPMYKDSRNYDRDEQFDRNHNEVSPRYLDAARKVFERFDENRTYDNGGYPAKDSHDYRAPDSGRNYGSSKQSDQGGSYSAPPAKSAPPSYSPPKSGSGGYSKPPSSSGSSPKAATSSGGAKPVKKPH